MDLTDDLGIDLDVLIALAAQQVHRATLKPQITRYGSLALPLVPWWETHAMHVSPEEFRSKFRIWPGALCMLVNRITQADHSLKSEFAWRTVLCTKEAKYIAHAACMMIHGMCMYCKVCRGAAHARSSRGTM